MDHVKKFWNDRPCNIRHGTAPIGTREYFDEVETRKYFVEPHIPEFAEFSKWAGKRVLEIGTGIGTDTINFLRAGADIESLDISEESVKIAQKRAEVFNFDPKCIRVHNAEEEFDARKFDLVYSFGVIHHTPNPKKVIENLARLQDAGGELRIMLYSKISYKLFWAMHENNRWDLGNMNDTIREFAEAQSGCPVAYTYTFDEIRELLNPWYKIEDIRKAHIFKWNVDKYKEHVYELDSAWENVTNENLKALEEELGWHTLVKAKRL
jgi:SAM-dependent methyltransferase